MAALCGCRATVFAHLGPRQLPPLLKTGRDRAPDDPRLRLLRVPDLAGLVDLRRTREDARAYAVKLTEEGRKALRAAEPLARRVDDRILDALPAKQCDQFINALASIISTLERPRPA